MCVATNAADASRGLDRHVHSHQCCTSSYSQCDVIRNSRGHSLNFSVAFKNFAHTGKTIRHVRSHQSCRRQPRLKPPRAQLPILHEQLFPV